MLGFADQFIQLTRNILCVLEPSTRIRDFNSVGERLLGVSRGDWIGKSFSELVSADDREWVQAQLYDALKGKPVNDREFKLIAANGKAIHVRWCVGIDEPTSTLLVSLMDVTSLVAERKLADFYKYAIDRADVVALTDARGVITYVNEAFCEISGFSAKDLVGKTHQIVKSGVTPATTFKDLWGTITKGEVWRGEICNRSRTGSLYWMDSVIVPQLDESGKPQAFIALRRDITARKKLEEQMILSEKMVSLGQMAGTIAHEIANPITVIEASATMILGSTRPDATTPPDLKRIHEQASRIVRMSERLESIIRGIRSMTRNSASDPFREARVADILKDLKEISQKSLLIQGVELCLNLTDPHLVAQCRSTQILQVLVNLVKNGADAVSKLPERWVKVDADRDGDWLRIRVIDSGKGIPPENKAHLFEAFFTTKELGHGTGLGLSISKQIIEEIHRGSLRVDEACANTCFEVRIPIQRPEQALGK